MIVGFSGKKQSGKNTAAQIWQLLDIWNNLLGREWEIFNIHIGAKHHLYDDISFVKYFLNTSLEDLYKLGEGHYIGNKNVFTKTSWIQKSYAEKLKQIVCLLTGCNREQLEDNEFKESLLPESWKVIRYRVRDKDDNLLTELTFCKEDAEIDLAFYQGLNFNEAYIEEEEFIPTYRWLLQNVGTNALRNNIHPDIWLNALFADYKKIIISGKITHSAIGEEEYYYPNWLITDCRFPNEIEAIKERKGITIRINREYPKTSKEWQELFKEVVVLDPDGWDRKNYKYSWEEELIPLSEYYNRVRQSTCKFNTNIIGNLEFYFTLKQDTHPSETSLDDYNSFDYVINNPTGSVDYLIDEIKKIMIKEKVINV